MAAQGDMHTLYVPRDALDQMAQSRGMSADAPLSRMPETQAHGGLMAIPAHGYFTALPEGMASDLAPLVKLDPARRSLAEVVMQTREHVNVYGAARESDGDVAESAKDAEKTGAARWADTHTPLPPEQVKVPGGGLRAHEAIGGHAIEKHVEKTEQELLDRYMPEPKISASSSFYNEAVAEEAIAAALKAHDAEIAAWITSGYKGRPPAIKTTMPHPIGITVPNGASKSHPTCGVQVGIKPHPLSSLGYYIITGYPI